MMIGGWILIICRTDVPILWMWRDLQRQCSRLDNIARHVCRIVGEKQTPPACSDVFHYSMYG